VENPYHPVEIKASSSKWDKKDFPPPLKAKASSKRRKFKN